MHNQADFDPVAESYDAKMAANPAMQYMRRVSLTALTTHLSPGAHVLEIGCGTGEEALALARHGVRVLATDPSAEMLRIAQRKAANAGLLGLIATRQLAARELGALLREGYGGALDGAYASFGPLNGEPDLRPVADALARLIRSGGLLITSVMNRYYALEALWHLLHGQPRQAIRRWRGEASASISPGSHVTMRTWYYTPAAFMRAFWPAFHLVDCRALTLLLPPPYLATLWLKHAAAIERLKTWEKRLAGRWPFYALGDHFLITLRRDLQEAG